MTTEPQTLAPIGTATGPEHEASPRIYVACLAAYNSGHLHGAWIDCTDPQNVWVVVRAMLAASPEPDAEEWAIHDYDGFEGCTVSEYASFDTVCELAAFITERGSLSAKLYTHFGDDLDAARASFDDYAGEHKNLAEFAENLICETGPEIPATFQYYIDWQAMGRDMKLNGDVFTIETGFEQLDVFWQR